jgi:hypothetical protein
LLNQHGQRITARTDKKRTVPEHNIDKNDRGWHPRAAHRRCVATLRQGNGQHSAEMTPRRSLEGPRFAGGSLITDTANFCPLLSGGGQ